MNLPLAVFGEAATLMSLMDWVSTLAMLSFVVFAFAMAGRHFIISNLDGADSGSHKDVTFMLVWLSVTFMLVSVLLYSTPIGPFINFLVGGWPDSTSKPALLASASLLSGVVILICAGGFAFIMHMRRPRLRTKLPEPSVTETSDD